MLLNENQEPGEHARGGILSLKLLKWLICCNGYEASKETKLRPTSRKGMTVFAAKDLCLYSLGWADENFCPRAAL